MNDLGEALLAAHVEHQLSELEGPAFGKLVEAHVASAFAWFEEVPFGEAFVREQIMNVIDRYVIELRVSGGITELAGQMANAVFSSPVTAGTRVRDVCHPQSYSDFADKIVRLKGWQRELVRYVSRSSAFETLASRVVSNFVVDLLFGSDDEGSRLRARERLAALGQKLFPDFERRLRAALSSYAERHAGRVTRYGEEHVVDALDPEWVRQMADEIWDLVSVKPLSEAASLVTAQDLEDFVVIGYEFWERFKKTPYFRAVCEEVVNRLFEKYERDSLAAIIGDMGVTEEMVVREIIEFSAPFLAKASNTGFLERELRTHLERFYRSPAALAILERT